MTVPSPLKLLETLACIIVTVLFLAVFLLMVFALVCFAAFEKAVDRVRTFRRRA